MKNLSTAVQQFEQALLFLGRSVGVHNAFSDFLDYGLLHCSWPTTKPEDFEIFRSKYPETDWKSFFHRAYEAVGDIATDDGSGFKDPFGDFFMEHLSHGKNGQYFTPEEICGLMVSITIGNAISDGKKIADPTCGSGRMLLAAAKINRYALFYGADLDILCCKMTVINMVLNSMRGEVAWMNTLTMEHYKSWKLDLRFGIPYCCEIPHEQSELAHIPIVKADSTTSSPTGNTNSSTTKKSSSHNGRKPGKGNDSQLQFLFD